MEKISRLLESKIIPLLQRTPEFPFIVARPEIHASALPENAILTPRPIKGKRVARRNNRKYSNTRLYIADYPDANLQEIASPKLACVIGGEADYLLGKYSVRCREGSIILIPPCTPHQAWGPFLSKERQQVGTCDLLQIYTFNNGINIWLSSSYGADHTGDHADNYFIYNQDAIGVFTLMMRAAEDASPHWKVLCDSLLTAFFVILLQEIRAGHFTRKGVLNREDSLHLTELDFIEQIQVYVRANCHRPLKLADVASHFFMSVSQLTRRLRQEGQGTLVEMLLAARIEQAKKFLIETNLTFTAIAGYCSFRTDSYFRTQFIKHVGCTPSEYRKRNAPKKRTIE